MRFGEKRIEMSDYDLDELFSYVFNSQKYRVKLEKSIENNLWEYATVLVWKNIVLFMYEKLFQIKVLGNNLPEAFNGQLQNGNITVHNCFDFCCINDDSIYTNLHKIWNNVESNYKQMFKGLLDDRNSLSHVNRYEEEFNEQWFKTYFEKALRLVSYLQNLNNIQLSQKIYDFIEDNKTVQYFSEEDINYLLSQESYEDSRIINHILDFMNISDYPENLKDKLKHGVISTFLDSHSFAIALENGKRLVKLAAYYDAEELKEILTGVFEKQRIPNQITQSGEMENVFEELFDNTINLEGLKEDWKIFIDKLIESDEERYDKLKVKFLEIFGEEETAEE